MSRRLVPAALLVTGALALTGCGTGLQAQTYTKSHSVRDFQDASVGSLEVRNLAIGAPANGTEIADDGVAVLTGSVVNLGTSGDSLVGASSAVAGKAQLQIDGVDVAAVPVPAGEGTGSTWAVVLSGLKTPLRSGQYVDVTLTFAKAGVLENLSVPVRSGDTGLADREEAQDPYHVEE